MSSSSSRPGPRHRVLRGEERTRAQDASLLAVDLRPAGLARLSPERVDRAVEEGRAEGYAAGWAEAEAAARAQAATELAAARARLDAVLDRAADQLDQALAAVAASAEELGAWVGTLAATVAEAAVGHELRTSPDRAARAAARALALTATDVEVVLRLHPEDAAALDTDALAAADHRPVRVVADDDLAPGDCVAQSAWTTVDARIGPALARARATLEGATTEAGP